MKPFLTLFSAFLCASVLYASGGFAQDAASGAPQDAVKTVVSEFSISLNDCRQRVPHQPQDDVAYQPGVDVHGNPVVPADIQPMLGQIQPPDEIVIDFGIDLAGRYGISGTGLITATAGILTVNYDITSGTLMVNGKPLLKDDARAVAKACKMMLKNANAQ